jgi:hypothetical protein
MEILTCECWHTNADIFGEGPRQVEWHVEQEQKEYGMREEICGSCATFASHLTW